MIVTELFEPAKPGYQSPGLDNTPLKLSDLRKTSLAAVKELHGMGPNAIRILTTEMKKADLSFRK